jgi:hypothetical protein
MTKGVLITVPHGLCPIHRSVYDRRCDVVASYRADKLNEALVEAGLRTILLRADLPREVEDLNRAPSRYSTEFREKVRGEMRSGKYDLLIDVHSFPVGGVNWPNNAVVLLQDTERDMESNEALARDLQTVVVKGIHNDIIDESAEFGIRSVLIEFIEHPISGDDRIMKIIARWARDQ